MPSDTLSHQYRTLYERFKLISTTYSFTADNLAVKTLDYGNIVLFFKLVERQNAPFTKHTLKVIGQDLATWESYLIALEIDNPARMRKHQMTERFNRIKAISASLIQMSPEVKAETLTLEARVDTMLSATPKELEELEHHITAWEKRVDALAPPPATEPPYVQEILRRANTSSLTFQRAPENRQRAILQPYAKDIAKRDNIDTSIATMISSTLHYMKQGA